MDKPQVFLSYSHRDNEIAHRLVNVFNNSGIPVFYDHSIEAGENWVNQLEDNIRKSELLIVLISRNSVQSAFVAKEYSYFVYQNKLILPVLIEGSVTDIPLVLQRFPHVDLREEFNPNLVIERAKELLENGYLIESSGKKQITITFDVDKDTDVSNILSQITDLKGTHGVRIVESDY